MDHRRIAIIEDHPLLASALRNELDRAGIEVEQLDPTVGAESLLEALSTRPPGRAVDCVVVDLGLPFPGGGPSLIAPMVDQDIRVVVLTGETDRQLLAQSSAAGAAAVLSKSEPLTDIVETILQVAGGQAVRAGQRAELAVELHRLMAERDRREAPFAELSPREQQILAGLMDGQAPSLLAEQHYVSVATVRSQIKSLLCKLGVSSQLQAVAMANRCRWTPKGDRQHSPKGDRQNSQKGKS